MIVCFCDVCGKKVYLNDSSIHKIQITDEKRYAPPLNLEICDDCSKVFWDMIYNIGKRKEIMNKEYLSE